MAETSPWNSYTTVRLTEMWNAGSLSCAQIARELGREFTRNAVIGKVHRLGLCERRPRGPSVSAALLERRRQERNASRIKRQRIEREAKKMREQQTAPEFVGSLKIPYADLRDFSEQSANQCRFISDEPPGPQYLACGNETLPGQSYCGHCHAMCFPPSNMTQKQRAQHVRLGTISYLRAQRWAAA